MSTSRLRDTLQILSRTEKTDLWRRESFPSPPRSHSEPLIDLISKSYSSVAVRGIFFFFQSFCPLHTVLIFGALACGCAF